MPNRLEKRIRLQTHYLKLRLFITSVIVIFLIVTWLKNVQVALFYTLFGIIIVVMQWLFPFPTVIQEQKENVPEEGFIFDITPRKLHDTQTADDSHGSNAEFMSDEYIAKFLSDVEGHIEQGDKFTFEEEI